MAITINIYYHSTNDNAIKFAKEMVSSGIVDRIRSQKGNLRYEYFIPLDNNQTVLLIDSWENQQALDIHHQSEMMNEIIKLRNKYDLHMRVERYIEDIDNKDIDKQYIKE